MSRTLSRMVLLTALAAAAVLVAGCTQAPTPAPTAPATPTPAPGSTAVKIVDGVQVVTIEAKDVKFAPVELALKAGRTKFIVPNTGALPHEMVLYPEADKAAVVEMHKKSMEAAMGHEEKEMAEKAIVVEVEDVDGGKTKESTVIDLKPGTYEFGCFVPGHYEAGMKGKITVA